MGSFVCDLFNLFQRIFQRVFLGRCRFFCCRGFCCKIGFFYIFCICHFHILRNYVLFVRRTRKTDRVLIDKARPAVFDEPSRPPFPGRFIPDAGFIDNLYRFLQWVSPPLFDFSPAMVYRTMFAVFCDGCRPRAKNRIEPPHCHHIIKTLYLSSHILVYFYYNFMV